jgi:hypothetical protein
MIIKKAFILAEAGDDDTPEEGGKTTNAKEKMKKRIEKAKTMSKISQQILSERGIHYQPDDPIKQLAA